MPGTAGTTECTDAPGLGAQIFAAFTAESIAAGSVNAVQRFLMVPGRFREDLFPLDSAKLCRELSLGAQKLGIASAACGECQYFGRRAMGVRFHVGDSFVITGISIK
jgi:hypothetical protein